MTHSTLAEWLSYLEQLHPQAIDMGLERVQQVAQHLGLKRPAQKVVTVTGTNGKGSTCALLAAFLTEAGLKVGVYSSPHLLHYNERVCIAGQHATEAQLCDAFARIEAARGTISLTYFEFGTLAALLLFQEQALDVAILEVGLGGRLDAVNVVDPDLAIVTSIGLDHAEWLGDSRESVAQEKAGIFRPAVPVVCGDLDPPQTLKDTAQCLQAPLYMRGIDYSFQMTGSTWCWSGQRAGAGTQVSALAIPCLPVENAATALQALALLWPELLIDEQLSHALKTARLMGRLDRRQIHYQGKALTVVLDVGHNPHAAEFLAAYIESYPVAGSWRAVFGLLADKDLSGVLAPLAPRIPHWAVTALDTPRTRSAQELSNGLKGFGVQVMQASTLKEALESQLEQASSEDVVLVFGSFYAVAEALAWLSQYEEGAEHVA